jgi:hypothetical protein
VNLLKSRVSRDGDRCVLMKVSKMSSNVKLLVDAELLTTTRDVLVSPTRDIFTNDASIRNMKGPPQITSGMYSIR